MVATTIPVDPFDLVLLGATGDLARRKILPALFHRFCVGQMPQEARIIGAARSSMNEDSFRAFAKEALQEVSPVKGQSEETLSAFLSRLSYIALDVLEDKGWEELGSVLRPNSIRAFYLSVAPRFFGPISEQLTSHGLSTKDSRIVVEKPFGHDLASAQALNADLRANFDESQIYRIDHYLGKETVQNLMALRFANSLWEPLWNARHVDHVQITVAEDIGVEGRGGYYDRSGAMRDMVQNHLMQLLCLTAMEPPARFTPDAVRDEKVKVIGALDVPCLNDVVRGQYSGQSGHTYLDHAENPQSTTESFIAMKVEIANWRWSGTPFYLRTGKKLKARSSEIAIIFKDPPHMIFPQAEERRGNALIIRLQPDEGITLRNTIKEPGPGGFRLKEVSMDMTFATALGEQHAPQDAYERLIMDVIRGDQTLFMRGDEVEAAWAWADQLIEQWETAQSRPKPYDPHSSGPEDALGLLHRDQRRWRDIKGEGAHA